MSTTHPLHDLTLHYEEIADMHMRALFAADPHRFDTFSLSAAGLLLDYSKNRITQKTLDLLFAFAKHRNLPTQIAMLFTGETLLNHTEQRPALHTALRDPHTAPRYLATEKTNITEAIQESLATLEKWVTQLQHHAWLGYAEKPITDVVHIGMGGSHLGPLMACQALAAFRTPSPIMHFVSSVDPAALDTILEHCNPETTLFIIASKTGKTQETLTIADNAKAWLRNAAQGKDISRHFIATTAQRENAIAYGIAPDLILPLWDWVGGRFSICSAAIGLPIALSIGIHNFKALLQGAYSMDQHFRTAPLEKNMPVILGLIGFWYIHFFKTTAHAVLPYSYPLRAFPHYLQQLEMESNGKHLQKNGQPVIGLTAPIVFGEMGTNGQHSFYQLLLQGTHLIPCDFIATIHAAEKNTAHRLLLAHCIAQTQVRMRGSEMEDAPAHTIIPGNQPSNTLLIKTLTPETLGALIALYEHKVYVQGVLWNINSFDQWGVEMGKKIAQEIEALLLHKTSSMQQDASTQGLLQYIFDS